MKVLGLDTSSDSIGLAITKEDKILIEEKLFLERKHEEQLIPFIDKSLKKINLTINDIELLSIIIGPGSFTGLRIGVSFAKGFSFSLNKPVVGVVSLDVLARNCPVESKLVIPIIDARRGNVYSAIYTRRNYKLNRISDYLLIKIEEFLEKIKDDCIFLGNATLIYRNLIEENMKSKKNKFQILDRDYSDIKPALICKLGEEKYLKEGGDDIFKSTPLYIYPKECSIIKKK